MASTDRPLPPALSFGATAGAQANRAHGVPERFGVAVGNTDDRAELSVVRGDVERARSLAQRYSATYPGDAHLPRLQALLARIGVAR